MKNIDNKISSACPSVIVKANSIESHQTSPGWCAAFVRFTEPQTILLKEIKDTINTQNILIVRDECISISTSSPKSSFAKTLSLTVKAGETYYLNSAMPGDWVTVWIRQNKSDIDSIVKELEIIKSTGKNNSGKLSNYTSGLRMVGRVLGVSSVDSVSENGVRQIIQQITCQAFMEFASSIYFTNMAVFGVTPGLNSGLNPNSAMMSQAETAQIKIERLAAKDKFKGSGSATLVSSIADMFAGTANNPSSAAPDKIMAMMIGILFGVSKTDLAYPTDAAITSRGTYSQAIIVPPIVSNILNLGAESKELWQFYNIYCGIQKYSNNKDSAWGNFCPIVGSTDPIFKFTPNRLKGRIWSPPVPNWSGVAIWEVLRAYLNPVVNEMYTCMRADEKGRIRPTVMIREIPFSTGLFKDVAVSESLVKQPAGIYSNIPRSFYCNLPRWVIDDNMIKRISIQTSESSRVNMVQVMATSANLGGMQGSGGMDYQQNLRERLTLNGNYVIDDKDIARNGLRLNVVESSFDEHLGNGFDTSAPLWAQMRADWFFNGHLKLAGEVVLHGVDEPICEGDNAQIGGIVFHIEELKHSASIDPGSGRKVFITTLSLTNGILAESLTGPDVKPKYYYQLGSDASNLPGPGLTNVSDTSTS